VGGLSCFLNPYDNSRDEKVEDFLLSMLTYSMSWDYFLGRDVDIQRNIFVSFSCNCKSDFDILLG